MIVLGMFSHVMRDHLGAHMLKIVLIIGLVLGLYVGARLLFRVIGRTPSSRPMAARRDPGAGRSESLDYVHIAGRMREMAARTLLMQEAQQPGFSKVGGEPDLPPGVEWPVGPEGPLAFLLQVELAAARAAGGPDWLPESGALWAFHDDRWDASDQVRVIHAPNGERQSAFPPITIPRARRYRQRPVAFSAHQSSPSLDWLEVDVRGKTFTDEELDTLADTFEDLGPEPHHRIGGYPLEHQMMNLPLMAERRSRGLDDQAPADAEMREAAQAWRMLFQVDYDTDLKMTWGDAGRFYVLVREADARAGEFSRTVTVFDLG